MRNSFFPIYKVTNLPTEIKRKYYIRALMCSTAALLSSTAGDTIDLRLEEDTSGPVLYVSKLETNSPRPPSPSSSCSDHTFKLSLNHESPTPIEFDGLSFITKNIAAGKVRLSITKGTEDLGYLDIQEDGTIHLATKSTSDHIYVSSNKDIYVSGKTSSSLSEECGLTVQTSQDVCLEGNLIFRTLNIEAKKIVQRGKVATTEFNIIAESLETSGEIRTLDTNVSLTKDWLNDANIVIAGCLNLQARSLKNRRRFSVEHIKDVRLTKLINSNEEGDLAKLEFFGETPIQLSEIAFFKNAGEIYFKSGVNIISKRFINPGSIVSASGGIHIHAEAVETHKIIVMDEHSLEIIAGTLTSREMITKGDMKLNISNEAHLSGVHGAKSLTLEGGSFNHNGQIEVMDTLQANIGKLHHVSGIIKSRKIEGTVARLINKGCLEASQIIKIKGYFF
ncbi:MAG: hypothetical protein H6492_01590 [Candidatus Paracaedibacteraceae bacterium]|nr:hypothetical protein [Candidatus Paracaedibacteraceae bacterium]